MNIKRKDLEWVQKPYLRIGQTNRYEFELKMYKPLSDWDVYDDWEKERIRSMRQHLEQGDILFDVGAEVGWMSVICGQMVHPSNMVLFEPTKEFWPNIEVMWHRNFDCEPLACYSGLLSDKTTDKTVLGMHEWPEESKGDPIDKLAYTYIHDNPKKIPEITIDEWVKQTGIVPDALTIDTEGSELLILRGAKETLAKKNLKIWVSVHDDLGLRDYGIDPQLTLAFLEDAGYKGEFLAQDHEAHWYFHR